MPRNPMSPRTTIDNVLFSRQKLSSQQLIKLDEFIERSWPQSYEHSHGLLNVALKLGDTFKLLPRIQSIVDSECKALGVDFSRLISQSLIDVYAILENNKTKSLLSAEAMKNLTDVMYGALGVFSETIITFLKENKVKVKLSYLGNLEIAREKLRHNQEEGYGFTSQEDQITEPRNQAGVVCQYLLAKSKSPIAAVKDCLEEITLLEKTDFSAQQSAYSLESLQVALRHLSHLLAVEMIELAYSYISKDYTIKSESDFWSNPRLIVELSKENYAAFRKSPMQPIVSVAGAPELVANCILKEAIPDEVRGVSSEDKDCLLVSVVEQTHNKEYAGDRVDGTLLPGQLNQYLSIYNNATIKQDEKGRSYVAISEDDMSSELFWFQLLSRSEQLEMVRFLQMLYAEAGKVSKSNGEDQAAIFSQFVNYFYSHSGYLSRVGPGVRNPLSQRELIYTKNSAGEYELSYDPYPAIDDTLATPGVNSRNTSMALSHLELENSLFEAEHVNLIADNIEQDFMQRCRLLLQRYQYDLGDAFIKKLPEMQFAVTRILINLLSPRRTDGFTRAAYRSMGKSFNNDDDKMTRLQTKACKQLREKYRYESIEVTLNNGKKARVKPNFAMLTNGVNAIRNSRFLGFLQVDEEKDNSVYVAALHQLTEELSLYAHFGGLAEDDKNTLLRVADLFVKLTISADVSLYEKEQIEEIEAEISILKEAASQFPNNHFMRRLSMRSQAKLLHLKFINSHYSVCPDYNSEAVSNALFMIAMSPELTSAMCKSGNDRTGSVVILKYTLLLYFVKYGEFPPLNESGDMAKTKKFFDLYYQVKFGAGVAFRERSLSAGEVGRKSVFGADCPGIKKLHLIFKKYFYQKGYAGFNKEMNTRVQELSHYDFSRIVPEEGFVSADTAIEHEDAAENLESLRVSVSARQSYIDERDVEKGYVQVGALDEQDVGLNVAPGKTLFSKLDRAFVAIVLEEQLGGLNTNWWDKNSLITNLAVALLLGVAGGLIHAHMPKNSNSVDISSQDLGIVVFFVAVGTLARIHMSALIKRFETIECAFNAEYSLKRLPPLDQDALRHLVELKGRFGAFENMAVIAAMRRFRSCLQGSGSSAASFEECVVALLRRAQSSLESMLKQARNAPHGMGKVFGVAILLCEIALFFVSQVFWALRHPMFTLLVAGCAASLSSHNRVLEAVFRLPNNTGLSYGLNILCQVSAGYAVLHSFMKRKSYHQRHEAHVDMVADAAVVYSDRNYASLFDSESDGGFVETKEDRAVRNPLRGNRE